MPIKDINIVDLSNFMPTKDINIVHYDKSINNFKLYVVIQYSISFYDSVIK